MSSYKSLVSDFPARCLDILRYFGPGAQNLQREVTLMLCIAASGINVPYERLQSPKENSPFSGHPARDWQKFEKAKQDFDDLMKKVFVGSPLCPPENRSLWFWGAPITDVSTDPSRWPELANSKELGKKGVKWVVKHVRNALAHGNIYTLGSPQKIENIVLLSKPYLESKEHDFLIVRPEAFQDFLEGWLSFLKGRDLGPEVFIEQILVAAI
jgi:hypothetical protein